MNKKTNTGLKIICLNRKASFNYFFENLLEAGIVLKGSEIKSVRDGKVNIADSYAVEKNGEIYLVPTIRLIDGKLKKIKDPLNFALEKGDFLTGFKNEEEATSFSKNLSNIVDLKRKENKSISYD